MRTVRPSIQVWLAEPGAVDARSAAAVLSAAELARADDLPAGQSQRFVLGRALLRAAVASTLGCHASDVVLTARCPECGGEHGAVTVEAPGTPIGAPHVSLTRAGPLIGVALSHGGPVGIDVESVAAVSAAPVADVALSPTELAAHRTTHPRGRDLALARSWARTEAALKAAGHGLRVDPALVDTRTTVAHVPGPGGTAHRAGRTVLLADLPLGPYVAGAVALACSDADARQARRLTVRRHDGEPLLASLRPS